MLTWRRNNSSFQGKLSNRPTLVENCPLPHALVRVRENHLFVVKRATTKDAGILVQKTWGKSPCFWSGEQCDFERLSQQFLETIGSNFSVYHFLAEKKTSVRRSRELYQAESTVYLMLQQATKLLLHGPQMGVTSQSTPLPSPLHLKLGCRQLEQRHNNALWRWGRESFMTCRVLLNQTLSYSGFSSCQMMSCWRFYPRPKIHCEFSRT